MADVKMVVVDGVRYRADEAPEVKAKPAPVNKASTAASNKKG